MGTGRHFAYHQKDYRVNKMVRNNKTMSIITLKRSDDGGWHIYSGISQFLIAEGSSWSFSTVGRKLADILRQPPYKAIRQLPLRK